MSVKDRFTSLPQRCIDEPVLAPAGIPQMAVCQEDLSVLRLEDLLPLRQTHAAVHIAGDRDHIQSVAFRQDLRVLFVIAEVNQHIDIIHPVNHG